MRKLSGGKFQRDLTLRDGGGKMRRCGWISNKQDRTSLQNFSNSGCWCWEWDILRVVLGNHTADFYVGTLWVIFGEILDSVYKVTRLGTWGEVREFCLPAAVYWVLWRHWEDDTKQQFRCTCHQMNESQRSNQAVQWKPDQSFLPFCQIVAAGNWGLRWE